MACVFCEAALLSSSSGAVETGAALYARMGKTGRDCETYFFIADGKVYQKPDAFLAVQSCLLPCRLA